MLTVKSLGHACYTFADGAHTLILDPWLTGNPDAVCGPDDVKVDFILPSHGHGDHLGDAVAISKAQGAPVVAVAELCAYCSRQGATTISMHIGGRREFPFGSVKLTQAFHGSAVVSEHLIEYTGLACGFLVEMGGRRAYFAGDTGLFGDMALIPGRQGLDLAILPIGDNYTMGVEDALRAVDFLGPKVVIPTHYHAFDAIRTDPTLFAERVRDAGAECRILAPGQETRIRRTRSRAGRVPNYACPPPCIHVSFRLTYSIDHIPSHSTHIAVHTHSDGSTLPRTVELELSPS